MKTDIYANGDKKETGQERKSTATQQWTFFPRNACVHFTFPKVKDYTLLHCYSKKSRTNNTVRTTSNLNGVATFVSRVQEQVIADSRSIINDRGFVPWP
ncbi:hypothetical protein NPIL_420431 [Nephila pilipes]|uniref:Uncharacterized protein n=1 Tax=Nephila pilipes TaxID=299642 RepID=A0A8X6JTL8_NEPPI|nr:hypothetical protein NPIL_420431 [Nephila pilipes]